MVRDPVRAGPAEVVGDEGRVDAVGEATERIEVGLVERGVPEEVETHPVQHDGVARSHRVEARTRRERRAEEVLADDLEVPDLGPVLEEPGVVRNPEAEPEGVARDRSGGHLATLAPRPSGRRPRGDERHVALHAPRPAGI